MIAILISGRRLVIGVVADNSFLMILRGLWIAVVNDDQTYNGVTCKR